MAEKRYKDPSATRQMSLAKWLKLSLFAILFVTLLKGFGQSSTNVLGLGGTTTSSSKKKKKRAPFHRDKSKPKQDLKIAFVGNSMLFYNDSPGLLVRMLEESGKYDVTYEACMDGGAALSTSWLPDGCNPTLTIGADETMSLQKLFDYYPSSSSGGQQQPQPQQQWDYVILQDHSRAPTIPQSHEYTMIVLREKYAPAIWNVGATPILLQTAAYRLDNPELGTFEEYTQLLHQGYQMYAKVVTETLLSLLGQSSKKNSKPSSNNKQQASTKALVSPVGDAYALVKQRNEGLWEQLYMADGEHPSALGTWLQVCVLYATMLHEEPPTYDPIFWKTGPGRSRTAERLPTHKEATELWKIALMATDIMDEQSYVDHS